MRYCEEYAALLDLFADGELTGPEMERVRDHLETCPGCRAYVDDALAIRAGFPDVEETVVPEGFAEGVMARVREDAAKERKIVELKRRGVRRWMGTAAALAACCTLVILVRTGPGFAGQTKDAAAPAGDAAAYDTTAIAGEETGIAPQAASEAAPEAAPESKETENAAEYGALEEAVRTAPEARTKMAELRSGDLTLGSSPSDDVSERQNADMAPAETPMAAPEAAKDEAQFHVCPAAPEKQPALYLSEEEAGGLLDEYVPVWESETERHYELTAEAYQALLTALDRPAEAPEGTEDSFLVVVTGSWA